MYRVIGETKFTHDKRPKVYWSSGPIRLIDDARRALAHVRRIGSPLLDYRWIKGKPSSV